MNGAAAPTRPSSMCDRDDHRLCATARARCNCKCHGPKGQLPPSPPSIRKETAMPPTALKSVPTSSAPGVALVRSDPPPKRRASFGVTRQIAALVPDVEAQPGVWFQVARWTAKTSAASAQKRLSSEFPDIAWEARRVEGGSALWARAEASDG